MLEVNGRTKKIFCLLEQNYIKPCTYLRFNAFNLLRIVGAQSVKAKEVRRVILNIVNKTNLTTGSSFTLLTLKINKTMLKTIEIEF